MAGSLEIYDTNGALARTIPLASGVTKIGSADSVDVTIDDPDVSRVHAIIEVGGSELKLTDLGGGSGTYVNRATVNEVALGDGDEIAVGATRMIVRVSRETSGRLGPEVETRPRVGKTFWARLFDDSDYSGHRGKQDLAPPPRSIPFTLSLFFMLNGRTLLFPLLPLAVAGSIGLASMDLPELADRNDVRLAAGIAVLGALAMWLVLRWLKLGLFVRGLNQRATLIEKLAGLGSYTDSTFNAWSGWSFVPTSYSGPRYVSIVEIRAPGGKAARTKVRGMEYRGEQFLYDPNKPERHLRASKLGVRATPDDQGQWQIAGWGRSLFLFLLASGAFAVVVWLGVVLTAGALD